MSYGQIEELAQDIHANARHKGWYDGAPKPGEPGFYDFVCSKLMLVVSEVSEACEEVRNSVNPADLQTTRKGLKGKPDGFGVELADAAIRLLDLARFMGLPIETLIREKHEYNKTRPHRHGGKTV